MCDRAPHGVCWLAFVWVRRFSVDAPWQLARPPVHSDNVEFHAAAGCEDAAAPQAAPEVRAATRQTPQGQAGAGYAP